MTEKRDLKRRVRERQAETGESYMTALRHVLAKADRPSPGAIPTIELVDLTPEATALGLKPRVIMYPELVGRVDPATVLSRFRDVLLATTKDRDLDLMRSVVMLGQKPRIQIDVTTFADAARFVRRAHAGLGGVSPGGHMLALDADGKRGREMLVFMLWLAPHFVHVVRDPAVIIATPGGFFDDSPLGLHLLEEREP